MNHNELSNIPLSADKFLATQRIEGLIKAFAEARKNGFKKIRFNNYLNEIKLAENFTIYDWLNETNQRNLKELLLSAFEYPFISRVDPLVEDEYLSHNYYFEDSVNGFEKCHCLGLAAAHIYKTLAISFSGSPSWENSSISIEKVKDGTEESDLVNVSNVFAPDCFNNHQILEFIEQMGDVTLEVTAILPIEKKKNFSGDHHGNDKLRALAERLVESPYVIEVVHSLPYSPRAINFIKETFQDGKIDLVLFWEDAGYGMRIQTTGRNMRETEAIAKLLEDEYC